MIPATDPVFDESSIVIYEKIHRAFVRSFGCRRQRRRTRRCSRTLCERRKSRKGDLQIAQRRTGDPRSLDNECFAKPVRADVMIDGRKIAGAAQRRTRRGLLQQGSIQGFVSMNIDLAWEICAGAFGQSQ